MGNRDRKKNESEKEDKPARKERKGRENEEKARQKEKRRSDKEVDDHRSKQAKHPSAYPSASKSDPSDSSDDTQDLFSSQELVESDARGDALREENRTLNRKVASLDEELKHYQRLETLQSGKVTREKERLRQQLEDAERRCQDATGTVRGLQDQVQTLEDELMTKTEAEGRVAELQRKNLKLQETLSAQETSESVERLGAQLAKTVAALTEFREEAHSKEEHLRQAKQDISQLSDALAYEKELNTSLHDQMESLVEVAGSHECKSAEQQQELRKIVRDSVQKDRQMSTLKAEIEGFKSQIRDLEDLVADEQKEVASLNDSMNSESKILLQTRSKLDAARKENLKGEEKITNLQRELQHSQEKITRLEQQIKEMESERETEVTSVAERLTATHEASVRRLEDTLLSYTRLQARDEYQVENLEESLREFGRRLAESELHTKEVEREREALNRNLRQEQRRRENDAQEYQRQIMRITEEMSLLKVRLEGVQEETLTWQRQCEDLEERHQLAEGGKGFPLQLQKFQHQVENLKDALLTTKLDARKAEEERGHAHEQVLSLIRECNNLEEQIHHLTKEKCRLQDRLLCKESDITLLVKENVAATAKDEHDSTERATRMEREKSSCLTETADAENFVSILRQQLTEAQMEIRRLKEGKVNGDGKENGQSLNICGGNGEITLYQLQSEIVAARRESSEARRMLLERESQGRMSQLKIDTLQRMLQDRQEEVSELEIKLNESQIKAHRVETEMAQLRAKVATLTTQLGHAQSLKRSSISSHASGQPGEVESLEHEVSALREEVTVKTDEINQLLEKETQNMARVRELQQDVTKITKSRDEANRKVVNLEGSLAEALESSTTTKSMEKMWEAQLASIQQEVSRLLCETTQLKECNVALHEQLSTSQSEGKHLRSEMRSKDVQLDELQHARDLLSNDVQVVVAAVKQWLHEQKTANSKLAGKLHQQNKHILHLNTEKQFLAERNTGLQKINHELSLQVQEFRVRLGLSFSSSPEKINKLGGMTSTSGFLSPLLLSPLGVGGSSRVVSATPPLESGFMQSSDSAFGASIFSDRYEDAFSTCSSEGSSGGGCQVPGPDLPGALQLEQLAHLADSLLLASRNINRNSSNMKSHKSHKMTSATSLGDLTSTQGHHGISSLGNARKTSSSVGNLSVISPIDFKEKPSSPSSKFNYRYSDPSNFFCAGLKNNNKGNDLILPPPVRERKTYQRLFHTPSIEEADEEDGNYSVRLDSAPQIRLPSHEQSHKLHHNTERSQTSQSVANSEALDSTVSQNSQNVTRLPDCCMDESSL